MELFVVEFGDYYERYIVGIARSIEESRAVANDYLGRVHYSAQDGAPYTPANDEFFSVTVFQVGIAGNEMDQPYEVLILNG